MQREVEVITAELREIGRCVVLKTNTEEDRQRFALRFRELLDEQRAALRAQATQCVYFIHAPSAGLIKIGRTTSLKTRLAGLRMGSPVPLKLLGSIPGGPVEEAALHARWAHLRSHGEWFKATDELLAAIDAPVFERARAG